jgi:hypothetical protein
MNAPFPLPEVRLVLCSACGSEGRIIRHFCGDDHDEGPCPVCEGVGSEIVEVEPIDIEDLAPAICDRFGGPCCEWACCKQPVTHRTPKQPPQIAVLDIEAMADLAAPLGSPDFFALWHDASGRKEAEYLAGDRTRQAWEA